VTTRAGTFTGLGWTWKVLDGHGLPHLVPQTVLALSLTACHRPLAGVVLSELPYGLFDQGPRCARCTHANGGQP
jgi:hypothetical protein